MNVIEAQAFITETIETVMDENSDDFDMATILTELYDLQGSWDFTSLTEAELIRVIEQHKG